MFYKGRRLKRFLGLRRDRSIDLSYNIEHILPDKIIGWINSNNKKLSEIRLISGLNLISKTSINIERTDVNKLLKKEGKYGFCLNLPEVIPPLKKTEGIRLVVVDEKKKFIHALEKEFKDKTLSLSIFLKKLLESDFIGSSGHFDGINENNQISGWALNKNYNKSLNIWLQTTNLNPIKIECDFNRIDVESYYKDKHNGFIYEISNLPIQWIDKKVYCSFDKEGLFKLPQSQECIIKSNEEINKIEIIKYDENEISNKNFLNKKKKAPIELESDWEELSEFKDFLDDLEHSISNLEKIENNKNKKFDLLPKIIKRIKKNIF